MSDQETAVLEETADTEVEEKPEAVTAAPSPAAEATEPSSSEAEAAAPQPPAAPVADADGQTTIHTLRPRQHFVGTVKNITNFGAFVDIGIPQDGLVHISELSWGRVVDPRQHAEINQMIQVLILKVNRDQCRVSLSVKRTTPNPWEDVTVRYAKGGVLKAKITEIVKFGVFARLEDGLEGLIHISEMDCSDNLLPKDLFEKGQDVQVEIVLVDPERQRMSLRLID